MKIAAIILAAGQSARFAGGNKLLAEIDGQPLIRHIVTAVAASPVDDIVLVIAPDGAAVAAAAVPGRWRAIKCQNATDGLSASLQTGLRSVDANTQGAMIVLADMPRVTTGLLTALCWEFIGSGCKNIVFPQSATGNQGNPVIWPRALFAELMTLVGDTGGKPILATYADLHQPVILDDISPFFDIDTLDDLENLRRQS